MSHSGSIFVGFLLVGFISLTCGNRTETVDINPLKTPIDYPSVQTNKEVSACEVKTIRLLGLGGENDWSPDGNLIVFDRRDASDIYQLYTIRPDGSEEKCITCAAVPGGPSLDRHKGFPAWHPSGTHIVAQVEMEKHIPLKGLTEPGRGAWNNLWVLTPDGQQWFQLTDYPSYSATGVLNPRFSRDGSKLFWAEKIGRATQSSSFGEWQLDVVNFVLDTSSARLENIQNYQPGNGTFFESHGFSPDGAKLLFTADIGAPQPFIFNIFTFDLATQELQNLTNSSEDWNEHANYSPRGNKISFISSRCCPGYEPAEFSVSSVDVLQAEAYVMNADGSEIMQITHFNTQGFPEYASEPSVATVSSWRPDGSQLVITQMFVGESYDTVEGRRMWILTFQGQCG